MSVPADTEALLRGSTSPTRSAVPPRCRSAGRAVPNHRSFEVRDDSSRSLTWIFLSSLRLRQASHVSGRTANTPETNRQESSTSPSEYAQGSRRDWGLRSPQQLSVDRA